MTSKPGGGRSLLANFDMAMRVGYQVRLILSISVFSHSVLAEECALARLSQYTMASERRRRCEGLYI